MRYAVPILALAAIYACEGRSPVEPSRPNIASVVGRVQDADSGQLVPSRVELMRDAEPGRSIMLTSPTGEFWCVVVPALWHLRVTADGYQVTTTDLDVVAAHTTITIGMRR